LVQLIFKVYISLGDLVRNKENKTVEIEDNKNDSVTIAFDPPLFLGTEVLVMQLT
jgi:hypothetical protein